MKHRFWVRGLLFALLFPWLCSSCSLTDKVPAGEQLYTGIGTVNYTFDKPLSHRRTASDGDSAGVITSIANAVDAVGTRHERRRASRAVTRRAETPRVGLTHTATTCATRRTREERAGEPGEHQSGNRRRAGLCPQRRPVRLHKIYQPLEIWTLDLQSFCRLQQPIGQMVLQHVWRSPHPHLERGAANARQSGYRCAAQPWLSSREGGLSCGDGTKSQKSEDRL